MQIVYLQYIFFVQQYKTVLKQASLEYASRRVTRRLGHVHDAGHI